MINKYTIPIAIKNEIDHVRAKFPSDENKPAIIESLLILQHHNDGFVTDSIMRSLAEYLSVSEIDVLEVATFYTMINTEPVGRNVISICNNVSCMLRGSDDILKHVEKKLCVKVGQSTTDKKFFLKDEIECLAACNGAPMMQINHKNYENLTLDEVDDILDKIK
tara:strand:- start:108 stop:599 length:492 start_codon:yes stop_codon:yes gene_type:complete